MPKEKIKKSVFSLRPYAERLILDTAKGYVFGCVFGAFSPSRRPLLQNMHENGKNFAKMSSAYSITEMSLEAIRKKDDIYNSMAAGAVAGALGSKKDILSGSTILGAYSGISTYFQKLNEK